jgi:predicted CoA-substrate-specific enzyme activase
VESGAHDESGLTLLGVDIGSTTVKIAVDRGGPRRWALRAARHHGRAHEVLTALCDGLLPRSFLTGVTGSGGASLAEWNALSRTHEVTALIRAARRSHPDARAIVDLGGQDSKLVLFDDARRPTVAMNDRCAAGTGVTIDRCLARLDVSSAELAELRYQPESLLPVSSRCGVFAETDVVNLARRGVPNDVIVSSLLDAIVRAALDGLAKGVVPDGPVLLIGGPHVYVPALVDAWRARLEVLWKQHDRRPGAVFVPDDPMHFSAIGAALSAKAERHSVATQRAFFQRVLAARHDEHPAARLDPPLSKSSGAPPIARPPWLTLLVPEPPSRELSRSPSTFESHLSADRRSIARTGLFVGIDAGSTHTKLVVIDDALEVVLAYRRESHAPIDDAREILAQVARAARSRDGASVVAIVATGYAASWIAPLVGAGECVVETAAHALAARAVSPEVSLVCDVGGQDIKVISLRPDGTVDRFDVSSRCVAGVGMALESTARELGVSREGFAAAALAAERAPHIDDACTVFLDASRVSLQRQRFTPGEILAGLARAVARVVARPLLDRTIAAPPGATVMLQGGVQHNEAALVAERDALHALIAGARVLVHPMPAFAGALGAALHARQSISAHKTRLPLAPSLRAHVDEPGRCELCENHCPRAIVEVETHGAVSEAMLIGGACGAGAYIDARAGARARKRLDAQVPDLLAFEASALFRADPAVPVVVSQRRRVRLGVPRALAMYRAAPLLRAYLQSLGVAPRDVVFSPPTERVLREPRLARSASDPCFPTKLLLDHSRALLDEPGLDALFVPRVTHAQTAVRHARDCASCPVVAASPALVRATFGAEITARRLSLLDPELCLADPDRLRAQLFDAFAPLLRCTQGESERAFSEALAAQSRFDAELRARARSLIDRTRADDTGVVLVLARPYHVDPSISHHVGAELQALGYPSLSIRALPREPSWLDELFADDLANGALEDPFDLRDLAPDCDNSGAAERIWGARVAARHGRIAALDLTSFKCAQDPPTFSPIAAEMRRFHRPYCAVRDLDETRPRASLRVSLLTLAHAMRERGLRPWT